MPINQKTLNRIKSNPFYKPSSDQLIPEGYEEEEEVKTFGIPPAVHTIIPIHPTQPKTVINKKKR